MLPSNTTGSVGIAMPTCTSSRRGGDASSDEIGGTVQRIIDNRSTNSTHDRNGARFFSASKIKRNGKIAVRILW